MPTQYAVRVDDDIAELVEEFKEKEHLGSQSETLRILLRDGLKANNTWFETATDGSGEPGTVHSILLQVSALSVVIAAAFLAADFVGLLDSPQALVMAGLYVITGLISTLLLETRVPDVLDTYLARSAEKTRRWLGVGA